MKADSYALLIKGPGDGFLIAENFISADDGGALLHARARDHLHPWGWRLIACRHNGARDVIAEACPEPKHGWTSTSCEGAIK